MIYSITYFANTSRHITISTHRNLSESSSDIPWQRNVFDGKSRAKYDGMVIAFISSQKGFLRVLYTVKRSVERPYSGSRFDWSDLYKMIK